MKNDGNEKVAEGGGATPRRKFTRNLTAFSSATLISRILGYIRDAAVAGYFGGGSQTDAFYAALKIPNLLRRFLGEGSLTAAFVPVFTDTLNKKGKAEAEKLFQDVFTGLLLILSAIVTLGIIFAPQITRVVSWGFVRDPEMFALTTRLTQLTFPFLLLVCLAALVSAVLNSCGRFFVPAVAPSGLSIGEIGFIVALASRMPNAIEGLAVSAVVGVGIHFAWQLPDLYREGYHVRLVRPFAHPEVKSIFLLMIPTIIGLCADQVNAFVSQVCASFLPEGSITALYNSNRVMQLPLALFGVAVASVALPALSHAAAPDKRGEFKDMVGFSLRIANYVLIPSFVGLAAIGVPIVKVLFEHGRFRPEYTLMTYQALVGVSIGLPAYSATKILASAFYARKNTKTPVRVAFQAMAVNAVLNVALMWEWGVAGLSFATAVAAWYQAAVLFWLLRRDIGLLGGRAIVKSFAFSTLAGACMGGLTWMLSHRAFANLPLVLNVLFSVGAGAGFYLLVSRALRIEEYRIFLDILRRRKLPAA